MKPGMHDVAATAVGGGAGMAFLLQVRWDAVPHAELVRIGLGVFLIVFGYFVYGGKGKNEPPSRMIP